jgi:DNA-3-methyladenine glycosylase
VGSPLVAREFFDRLSVEVAPELLGCVLEHETAAGLVAVELTEVEAYAGEHDPASHAWRGRTPRNAVMYGPAGHAYVYFTYGMHFCVNLVCQPEGTASAVLLRAGRIVAGEDLARARRARNGAARAARDAQPAKGPLPARDLARGPARLCQALAIDRALDGADACVAGSPLRIRQAARATPGIVRSGPRVGVSQGASAEWRFWADGDPSVSPYRPHVPRRRPAARPELTLPPEG